MRSGLAATGSQTVKTDGELFVADDHFSTPTQLSARLSELNAQRHRASARRPCALELIVSTGVALGMADNAMDVFVGGVEKRSIPYSPYARQVDAPITHLTVGQAHTQIRAASAVADAAVAQLDRYEVDRTDPSDDEATQLHTDVAYVWDACSLSGRDARSALPAHRPSPSANPSQLIARNCRAGSLHSANTFRYLGGEHRPHIMRRRSRERCR